MQSAMRLLTASMALAAVLAAAAKSEGSCGASKPPPADCERPDMGSCGNACCAAELSVASSPAESYAKVKDYLTSGGGDGLFAYVSGPDAGGNNPPDNITSFNIATGAGGKWLFMVKGTHTTFKARYVDELNVAIRTAPGGGSVLRLFTASGVHGALGDGGQTFKTLAYLSKGVLGDAAVPMPIWGCGLTASSMPAAPAAAGTLAAAGGPGSHSLSMAGLVILPAAGAAAALLAVRGFLWFSSAPEGQRYVFLQA
mmetsp:Transcript_62863/g.142073  ORF Transcript_62863/g.142073 Transcript_62863/m.142073 type:complete len:255 (+) Transcript_62863:71-835(+)